MTSTLISCFSSSLLAKHKIDEFNRTPPIIFASSLMLMVVALATQQDLDLMVCFVTFLRHRYLVSRGFFQDPLISSKLSSMQFIRAIVSIAAELP